MTDCCLKVSLKIFTNILTQLDTDSVEEFARATRELKFESYNGGRDSKERLAQVITEYFPAIQEIIIICSGSAHGPAVFVSSILN